MSGAGAGCAAVRGVLLLAALAAAGAQQGADGEQPVSAPRDASAPLSAWAAMAAEGRWDELSSAAAERIAQDPGDAEALYWSARARIARATPLLEGRRFERHLAISLLAQAVEELKAAEAAGGAAAADAAEWRLYARWLHGEDLALPEDLERAWSETREPYAAYLRGLVARDSGEDGAAEWLERAVRAAPERAEFPLALAEALGMDGRRAEAIEAWMAALESGAEGGALLSAAALILPGRELAEQRLALVDRVAAREPAWEADGLFAWHRAFALQELGRHEEAQAAFARATAGRSPGVERAHGGALARLGRSLEAAEHLARAARLGEAAALEDLLSLAGDLGRRRRWDEALSALDRLLEIEPRHVEAVRARALTLSLAGRSLEPYRELARRFPANGGLLNDAALAADGWGEADEARALIESAAALPGEVDARENLAALLLRDGGAGPDAAPRALALLREVLEAEPRRDRALALLGEALRRAGPAGLSR